MSGDKGDWVGRIGYVVSSLVVTEEEVHGANRGMAGKKIRDCGRSEEKGGGEANEVRRSQVLSPSVEIDTGPVGGWSERSGGNEGEG